MVLNIGRLADVILDESSTCLWPDCHDESASHGYCRKHGLRIERGWEVGTESRWESLVAAALAFASAETDEEFQAATSRLQLASRVYAAVDHGGGNKTDPETEQRVIDLRVSGMSLPRIAKMTGVPQSSVYGVLRRYGVVGAKAKASGCARGDER